MEIEKLAETLKGLTQAEIEELGMHGITLDIKPKDEPGKCPQGYIWEPTLGRCVPNV